MGFIVYSIFLNKQVRNQDVTAEYEVRVCLLYSVMFRSWIEYKV